VSTRHVEERLSHLITSPVISERKVEPELAGGGEEGLSGPSPKNALLVPKVSSSESACVFFLADSNSFLLKERGQPCKRKEGDNYLGVNALPSAFEVLEKTGVGV